MKNNKVMIIIALSFVSFALGVVEFVPMGLLIDMSNHFNKSADTMGLVISVYALGAAIGTPILIYFIAGLNRRTQLIIVLTMFVIANFVIYFVDSFPILILARIVSGIVHGSFFTISILIVNAISSEKNKAFLLSLVLLGLNLSLVFGIPLGTLIGKIASWETVFLSIAIVGILIMISAFFIIPPIKAGIQTNLLNQLSILKCTPIVQTYIVNIAIFAGITCFIAYIAKSLEFHHIYSGYVSILLFCYGIATIFGNFLGSKLSSIFGSVKSLKIITLTQAIIFIIFYFVNDSVYLIAINLFAIGVIAFATATPSQMFTMESAREHKLEALDVAMGFRVSTIQIGIAFGSFVGGKILAMAGIEYTVIASGILFILAFFLVSSYKKTA